MSPVDRRKKALAVAMDLGYPDAGHLPLGDPAEEVELRPIRESAERACTLAVVISVSYGFGADAGREWMASNRIDASLTPDENSFLQNPTADDNLALILKSRVEALWALCWAVGLIPALDFGELCGDNLVKLLPDLKNAEPIEPFIDRCEYRDKAEILFVEDLAYCLHWGVVEAQINEAATPGKVPGYVIQERQRALSWLLGDDDWDDVPMDT